jgi:type VI protein secretion system component Hcp
VTDFTVKKSLDRYSPALLTATANNQTFKTATIYIVHSSTSEELDYVLTNAILVGDHHAASDSGSAETLQLSFQKVQLDYLKSGKAVSTGQYSNSPAG